MQFYAKYLTEDQLAEAAAFMPWLNPENGGTGLSSGAIAGIVVGSVVGTAAVAAAVFLLVKRRRRPPVTDAEAAIRVLKVRRLASPVPAAWVQGAAAPAASRLTRPLHGPPWLAAHSPAALLRAAGC